MKSRHFPTIPGARGVRTDTPSWSFPTHLLRGVRHHCPDEGVGAASLSTHSLQHRRVCRHCRFDLTSSDDLGQFGNPVQSTLHKKRTNDAHTVCSLNPVLEHHFSQSCQKFGVKFSGFPCFFQFEEAPAKNDKSPNVCDLESRFINKRLFSRVQRVILAQMGAQMCALQILGLEKFASHGHRIPTLQDMVFSDPCRNVLRTTVTPTCGDACGTPGAGPLKVDITHMTERKLV